MPTVQRRRDPPGRAARWRAVAAVTAGLAAGALTLPAQAHGDCRQPPQPAEVITEVPWAQQWLAPERAWRHSRGEGVMIAVIDSGVDASHPQLAEVPVRPGADLVEDGGTDGRVDCHSHGTAVASLIAAAPVAGIGFHGLAPAAEILPVRVAEQNADPADPDDDPPISPDAFAAAIAWATDEGAHVINVSLVFYHDHPVVAESVRAAVDAGVLVVASVGQHRVDEGPHPTPYPAAYPGVLAVGAVDQRGLLGAGTYTGPHLELLAPGEEVTAAVAAGGHQRWTGTSFATPFVSATAALVWSARPELTAEEVAERLVATADPGPAGAEEAGHGVTGPGVVNPYRAIVERLDDRTPVAARPPATPVADPLALARAQRWQRAGELAQLVTLAAAGAGALAVTGLAVWRRGRRAGWRPSDQPTAPAAAGGDPASPYRGTQSSAVQSPEDRFYTVPRPREGA